MHAPARNTTLSGLAVSALGFALTLLAAPALAFVSGSTGADGAFNPTVSTTVTLPPSGIFNYTTINIPSGVTVTFVKNTTNTPVVMLASGNVTIAGIINVSGTDAAPVGTTGTGNVGDDGQPGVGGPGGYSGGRGGAIGSPRGLNGGDGLGPGGGQGGYPTSSQPGPSGGSGGYATGGGSWSGTGQPYGGGGGPAYGSQQLLPLIGGSGGGGAGGGTSFVGSGGGGGGGAILIASSGTISLTGQILADGGGGSPDFSAAGAGGRMGGCGSGGGVRLVATTISGAGTVRARDGGTASAAGTCWNAASSGFIRMEAETFTYTGTTTPTRSFASPGPVFIAGQPTVAITSVAGVNVPAAPTGVGDVQLPSTITNPVTVTFQTTGIPVGNTIKLTVVPATGPSTSYTSGALTGSTSSASASVSATMPSGPSTLLATVTYTIVASLGDALSNFAENQRVERVEVVAAMGGKSEVHLITASGRSYPAPPQALALLYGTMVAAGS